MYFIADESEYKHYRIINRTEAIKGCVNKASSLKKLEKNGVNVIVLLNKMLSLFF